MSQDPAVPARAVLYARVSSKEQEKDGFSIPAQQKSLRRYAGVKAIQISKEFTDVETAKSSGRTGFGETITFMRRTRESRTGDLAVLCAIGLRECGRDQRETDHSAGSTTRARYPQDVRVVFDRGILPWPK